jgi:hypothetical protein
LVDGHGRGDLDDGEPEFGAAFPAGGGAAPVADPAVAALDGPAVLCVGVGGFGAELASAPDLAGWGAGRDRLAWAALFTDARLDPARVQLRVELGRGVAAVGPQLGRGQAAIEQLVDERQQVGAFVLVARPDADRQRGASGVDG